MSTNRARSNTTSGKIKFYFWYNLSANALCHFPKGFIAVVLFAEITGPIMLESYRVIADYSKSSKYELPLKMGDMVDIVEKSPNGEQDVKYGCTKTYILFFY